MKAEQELTWLRQEVELCRFCGQEPRRLPSQYCSTHCYSEGRLRELRQADVENWLIGGSAHSTVRGLKV